MTINHYLFMRKTHDAGLAREMKENGYWLASVAPHHCGKNRLLVLLCMI